MIKQDYSYSFFYDNYKYRYHNMFNNYYNKLDKEYRYFILVSKDINTSGYSEVYRSNLPIEDVLNRLKGMEFKVTRIIDKWSDFPSVNEYLYNKFENFEQIIKIYRNGQSNTRKFLDDSLIYMYYAYYGKNTISARLDDSGVSMSYNSYRMYSNFDSDKITVKKTTPLSAATILEYNSDHKEMIEKALSKLMRDNVRGFYDDLIQSIKEEFRIR